MNISSIISANNLKKAAGLGAGNVAARFVSNKVKTLSVLEGKDYAEYAAQGVPVLVGLYLSGQKNSLINAVGNGMIATGVGNVFASLIDKDGTLGIKGTDVLMQGTDTLMSGMNGIEEEAASPSYPANFLGQNASGEMEF